MRSRDYWGLRPSDIFFISALLLGLVFSMLLVNRGDQPGIKTVHHLLKVWTDKPTIELIHRLFFAGLFSPAPQLLPSGVHFVWNIIFSLFGIKNYNLVSYGLLVEIVSSSKFFSRSLNLTPLEGFWFCVIMTLIITCRKLFHALSISVGKWVFYNWQGRMQRSLWERK